MSFRAKTCLISSHVKRSPLQKNVKVKWFGDFIGVYMINSTLHGCLEIRNFSSREKIFHSDSFAAGSFVKYICCS